VNKTLRRLTTIVMVMFLALMVSTTWIQFVEAESLNNNGRNSRRLFREFNVHRGPILAGDVTLAESVPVDSAFGFQRVFSGGDATQANIFAPVTGFFSIANGSSQLENTENDWLSGQANALWTERLEDLFTGQEVVGSSVETTINPAVQQAAWDALDGQRGSIVAVEPATGRILAMVDFPSYDPNELAPLSLSQASQRFQELAATEGNPMLNQSIGQLWPPGSAFKMIPAAAALESGYVQNADVLLPAPHRYLLPGTSTEVRNFGDAHCSPDGMQSIHDAMIISCNTLFMEMSVDMGADVIAQQARRFGFDDPFRVPMRSAISSFPNPSDLYPARLALAGIGQGDVTATPLQMAMVSAAIGNHGVLMQPYLVETIRNPDLDIVFQGQPHRLRQAVSESTAGVLRDMLVDAVSSPRATGRGAIISGVQVAGKTGTAESAPGRPPHAWFTAFAPADNPQVAVAVLIHEGGRQQGGVTGGALAAPVARQVIQAVLNR
jgi:peptidoglycan glycosyltransferase